MMLPIYRVPNSSFIDVPNANTFVIFQRSTDNLFYAKVNNNGIISVVALGGGSLTGYLYNNIDTSDVENHINNDAALVSVQLSNDITVSTIRYPDLVTLINGILLKETSITAIDFSLLETAQIITIDSCNLLDDIDFPQLTSITRSINIVSNAILNNVSIPLLGAVAAVNIHDNPNLVSIGIGVGFSCANIDLTDNALNQLTVDSFLTIADASGLLNGTIDISGGTNSAPGVPGAAAKLNLQGKGWTVNNN